MSDSPLTCASKKTSKTAANGRRCESRGETLPPNDHDARASRQEAGSDSPAGSSHREFQYLRERQKRCRFYNENASHIGFRKHIVQWMLDQATLFHLSIYTVCLAVSYVDRLFCKWSFPTNKVQLVSGCCLVLASKMAETAGSTLDLQLMREMLQQEFTLAELLSAEVEIASILDYKLNDVTPFDVVEFLIGQSRRPSGASTVPGLGEDAEVESSLKVRDLCHSLLRRSLFVFELTRFSSLAVASAILCIARSELNFERDWPAELEEITTLKEEDLHLCIKQLLYALHRQLSSPDLLFE